MACRGPGWHHGENLALEVVTTQTVEEEEEEEAAAATLGSPPPSVVAALPCSLALGDMPETRVQILLQVLKQDTVVPSIY